MSPKYPRNSSFNLRKHGKAKSATAVRAIIFSAAVTIAKNYNYKAHIDNIKRKRKIKRRPKG